MKRHRHNKVLSRKHYEMRNISNSFRYVLSFHLNACFMITSLRSMSRVAVIASGKFCTPRFAPDISILCYFVFFFEKTVGFLVILLKPLQCSLSASIGTLMKPKYSSMNRSLVRICMLPII